MDAVAELKDPFARLGLTLLRAARLRVGELLDLEFGSVADYSRPGRELVASDAELPARLDAALGQRGRACPADTQ
ncbi:hypothetical protein [Rhodococcus sp. USK13]|uniref:hypothetical protein n=1 Tax=Rhodococcus sp. USK13 TaxID=2806442 RepID=UPI0020170484|nr:hypothetical protein [Rhodococcus sp. USK13]